jgi:hypothetical protein
MNMPIKQYFPAMTVGLLETHAVRDFLYEHLDEYGDTREDISRAIEYALNAGMHPGGVILTAWQENISLWSYSSY